MYVISLYLFILDSLNLRLLFVIVLLFLYCVRYCLMILLDSLIGLRLFIIILVIHCTLCLKLILFLRSLLIEHLIFMLILILFLFNLVYLLTRLLGGHLFIFNDCIANGLFELLNLFFASSWLIFAIFQVNLFYCLLPSTFMIVPKIAPSLLLQFITFVIWFELSRYFSVTLIFYFPHS